MIFPVFTSIPDAVAVAPRRLGDEGAGADAGAGGPDISRGWMVMDGVRVACALGRGGVCAGADKREGDGRTPAGTWPMRRVLWRADREARPVTGLPIQAIGRQDGWCDDPGDPDYNRPVRLPHPARAETLWREDHLYDLLVVLGHNDDPVVAGAGSAIFLHLARPGYGPTEGCVALARHDLLGLLALARPGDRLQVVAGPEAG